MNDLAPEDRPREKMERAGVSALGDNELVAMLVGHGVAGTSALALANRVLRTAGGTRGLTRISLDELAGVPGIGRVLAGRVLAAIELGRRTLVRQHPMRDPIASAGEAAARLLPQYGAHPVERFGVMLLDSKYRVIRTQLVSVGSLDGSSAHPREVFRDAVRVGAAAIIAFHNHPSGDPTPSHDDYELTARLLAAGEVVGIQVLDHLILADGQYCSMVKNIKERE
jgi:DNA repair protein RadC